MSLGPDQIEDALLARIREQLPYLAHCDSYCGEMRVVEEEIAITGINFPAVLAMMMEDGGESQSKTSYEAAFTFRLLVCCRNLRGQRAARRDSYGVYQILGDLKAALVNEKLGLAIEKLQYPKTQPVSVTQEQAIYAMEFKITCSWP